MSLERLKNAVNGGELKPLLCLEVNPPRGVEVDDIFERLNGKLEGVDFFNVTDSALARMKFSALPFASLLKARFRIEPLVNLSCRDRNLIAIQGDLLAGWATGVRAVVALTGDAVTIGDSPDRKGVFEVNSIGLLNTIYKLNSGVDVSGNELQSPPEYFPGVVVNPNARNQAAEIKRLAKKREAGARFALSQPVFDEANSTEFFSKAKEIGIPIFMGLLPFKSAKAVLNVVEFVPGIKISEDVLKYVNSKSVEDDLSPFFIERCLSLAKANRSHVCGFHVVSGVTPKLALRLTHELAKMIDSL